MASRRNINDLPFIFVIIAALSYGPNFFFTHGIDVGSVSTIANAVDNVKTNASDVVVAATAAVVVDVASSEVTTTESRNGTVPSGFGDLMQNRGMIVRMTYVLAGFSLLILVYFVVKAVRLRNAKSRTRKYGVLSENLDTSPIGIDADSDDEEVEVFEVHGSNIRGGRIQKGNTAADRLLP